MSNDYFVCHPQAMTECFENEPRGKCACKDRVCEPTKAFFTNRDEERLRKIRGEITAKLEICAGGMLNVKICSNRCGPATKWSNETNSERDNHNGCNASDGSDNFVPESLSVFPGVACVPQKECTRLSDDILVVNSNVTKPCQFIEQSTSPISIPRWVLLLQAKEQALF